MALVLFALVTSAHAQNVLEDAEDGLTTGWRIYDSTPAGASISNIADGESRAISFTTDGTANGFRFGGTSSSNGGLDIRDSTRISWRMRSAEDYVVYIALETDLGLRYLTYTNSDKLSPAGSSTYINIGLGADSSNDSWVTITRNLKTDLQAAQPANNIIAVHGVLIRGTLLIDDIQTLVDDGSSEADNSGNDNAEDNADERLLEDAEDGLATRWRIYDPTPVGASISNVIDGDSRVISFTSDGTANGFRLGGTRSDNGGLNIQDSTRISWRMRAAESYTVYIALETNLGLRYLTYTDSNNLSPAGSSTYINIGLGAATSNNSWVTITRNLETDLQAAQANNDIIAIHGVLIRGPISVDDIKTLSDNADPDDNNADTEPNQAPAANAGADQRITLGASLTLDGSQSSDSDGNVVLYQWHNADGSLINSGNSATAAWTPSVAGSFSVTLTVTDNQGATDTDTSVIIVDAPVDADAGNGNNNDGNTNENASDRLLEDAEDGLASRWRIYDRTPAGASINNVIDNGTRVISFTSDGIANGFRLGGTRSDNGGLNIQDATHISWRMRAAESYVVYIALETDLGLRYLTYTNSNNLSPAGSSTYINIGLGAATSNDSWVTITRKLETDLHAAQPDNDIIAIHGVLVRGPISIDDIRTLILDETETETETDSGADTEDQPSSPDLSEYELAFADEFNGNSLDSSKWNTGLIWGPYLPINNEEQLYVDTLGINQGSSHSPFSFNGETITITATPTSAALQPPPRPAENDPIWNEYNEYRYNGPTANGPGYDPEDVNYLSGIITSYDTFRMTHGYVEARVKLPPGPGLWPAFWLLNTHYVEDSPEIDVMEFLGQTTDRVYHTYHYFDVEDNYARRSTPSYTSLAEDWGISDWTEDFHTYGVAWSPREIVWYVDGIETRRITDQDTINGEPTRISRQSMYLIANLAVGGNWPGSPDANTPLPAAYEIDYIRAYKKKLSDPIDLAADYQLMFNDEFNGSTLDTDKWNTSFLWGPYLTINSEEQYYVDANGIDSDLSYSPFSVSDGVLSITADLSDNSADDVPPATLPDVNDPLWQQHPEFRQGPYDGPPEYTSGIITSYDSFKFVHGYAEIRAKVPEGDGLWPAFWLLNAYYVGNLPEIDIMEILGENTNRLYHSYHRSNDIGEQQSTQFITDSGQPFSDGFHTYGVRWQPGRIDWYVDGQPVHAVEDDTIAYQIMYVIANLAVGGNFNQAEVDPSVLPARLDIDYIRVYQENDTP